MGEQIKMGYRRLFEILLLHHYWLDDWLDKKPVIFDLLPDKKRDARLLTYDVRSVFGIEPTTATARVLRGFGGLFKETAYGCVVAVPNQAVIPADAIFRLIVTVRNADVMNYTALTLRRQKIYELYHQAEGKTYRYKENVPLLSNATGVFRSTGPAQGLYLSKKMPTLPVGNDAKTFPLPVEGLALAGTALVQLVGDQPEGTAQQLGTSATDLPLFVHQGDVPAINPPTGLAEVPAGGIQLTDDIPDNVFALIELIPARADVDAFSFIDAAGHAKFPYPVFHVRFKNRSTIWRYVSKITGAEIGIESAPLPLTHFGTGAKRKPSKGLARPVKDGDKITQLVSDIYV